MRFVLAAWVFLLQLEAVNSIKVDSIVRSFVQPLEVSPPVEVVDSQGDRILAINNLDPVVLDAPRMGHELPPHHPLKGEKIC